MIPLQLTITGYDKAKHTCTALLQNGNSIELDPFVSCAIHLSDAEYDVGKGAALVGKQFVMTQYSVYSTAVVPHEDGFVPL